MTLLTKIATNYFICAWVCMVVSSIFAISGLFMDSVYYPKWITTEVVVVFFCHLFSSVLFEKEYIVETCLQTNMQIYKFHCFSGSIICYNSIHRSLYSQYGVFCWHI